MLVALMTSVTFSQMLASCIKIDMSDRKDRKGETVYVHNDKNWGNDLIEIKGKPVTKSFNAKNFDKISSDGFIDVEYVQGPLSVKVTAPSDLFDYLNVIVKGGELRLAIDAKKGRGIKVNCETRMKAVVSSPTLRKIKSSGSADLDIRNLNTNDFEISTNGSGDVDWENGSAENLIANISGSGDLEISNVTLRRADIQTAGSGDISLDKVSGSELDIRTMGSGDVETKNIEFNDVTAQSLGSGDMDLSGVCRSKSVKSLGSGKIDDRKLKRR